MSSKEALRSQAASAWQFFGSCAAASQVAQDIRPIFLPNVGPILVTILDQYWSETLANALDRYRSTLDQYCTNIQPICNQYYLPYLSFSSPPPAATDCLLLLPHVVQNCLCLFMPLAPHPEHKDHRTIGVR